MISPLPLPDLSISRHIFSRTKHICSIIRKILTTLLLNLKPEILKARPTQKAAPIPHSTTWINGLRGWMSLLVVILHLTSFTYPYFQLCYGAEISPGVYNTSLIAWPLFRLPFVGGQMAVSQFFIISGYVGTKRLLVFLYEEGGKRSNDFMDAVNSAIVRRPLRLYLPVMWSTLFFTSFQQVFNIAKSDITLQPTFLLELQRWTYDMLQFFYFIKDIDGPPLSYYNFHTWTISVEFRGSLLVLVWIFGLRYVKTNVRVLLTLAMILYLTLANAGVLYAATFAGMLTADLDIFSETSTQFELLTTEIPKPFTGTKIPWILRIQRRYSLLRQTILYILLLTSLYLAAQPNDWLGFHASPKSNKTFVLNNCHGWKILSDLIPPVYNHSDSWHHFWLFWSAWMLFVAIKETYIRKFFELRFSQCTFLPHYHITSYSY